MRTHKIIAIMVLTLGVLYLIGGICASGVIALERKNGLMTIALSAQGQDPGRWKMGVVITAIVYGVLGTATIVAGLGILKVKMWARRLWLGISSLVILVEAMDIVSKSRHGITTEDIIEPLVVTPIIICSFVYLFRRKTIQ